MGLFDEVYIDCPKCEGRGVIQSKSGPCGMNVYTVNNVPMGVLNDFQTIYCDDCNYLITVRVVGKPTILVE